MRWCPRLASPSVPTATSRRPSSSRSRASPWLLRTSLGAPCGIMVRYSRDPQNDVKCTLRCTMGCCVIVGVMVLLCVSLAWRLLTLIASVICMVAAVLWLLRARCGSVTPLFAPPVSWVWSLRLALHAWRIRACAGQATHGTCGQRIFCGDGVGCPGSGWRGPRHWGACWPTPLALGRGLRPFCCCATRCGETLRNRGDMLPACCMQTRVYRSTVLLGSCRALPPDLVLTMSSLLFCFALLLLYL